MLPFMRAAGACVIVLGLAKPKPPPPPPPAAPPPADVETAEQLYAKLDYDRANEVASRVVELKGLTHDQLTRATKVLAVTDAILDKEDDAKDAFLQLLVYDPDFTVDQNLGPKVSAPFMEARGQYRNLPSKPGLDVTPHVRSDGGELRVVIRDPTHLSRKVNVGYRWTSSGDFTVQPLNTSEGSIDVTAAPPGRTRLDFYAQALDEHDNAVFEVGNASVPKSAFAETGPKAGGAAKKESKEGGGITSSPVFWVIVSAVVIGGAVTGGVFLFKKDDPTSASLSPQIRCGIELCK